LGPLGIIAKKVYASFEIRDLLLGAKGFVITETTVSSILFLMNFAFLPLRILKIHRNIYTLQAMYLLLSLKVLCSREGNGSVFVMFELLIRLAHRMLVAQ